jgi:hypothetical protein
MSTSAAIYYNKLRPRLIDQPQPTSGLTPLVNHNKSQSKKFDSRRHEIALFSDIFNCTAFLTQLPDFEVKRFLQYFVTSSGFNR